MEIYAIKIEHLTNPMGIGAKKPRFSWKIKSDERNLLQKSYRIRVTDKSHCLWDSGRVENSASQNILYDGEELQSRQRLCVKIELVAEGDAGLSYAVGTAHFEMGLLDKNDWKCKWIEMEEDFDDNKSKPAPYIRKKVLVGKGLKSARTYQTAHGTYRFWINGREGSDRRFAPGNTSYYGRLQYQVDDITDLLQEGENLWAIKVADGWWRGAVGAFSERNNYGFKVQFLGQIILEYDDGSTTVICMDDEARTARGGTITADPKFGTVFNNVLEPQNWKMLDFDDSKWEKAHYAKDNHANLDALIAEESPKCLEKENFLPRIFTDKAGNTVLDFGQNIAGYVRMKLRNCQKGQVISLQHGEGLKDGVFSLDNIIQEGSQERDEMLQQVVYTARGKEIEEFCPEFSIFGFRYVKLTGYPADKIQPMDFIAVAVYSDLEDTYSFACSDELISRMVKNARWSQKGNYLDVPTDCPTRERAPWTGDAAVYAVTSAEFLDVYAFFEKWLKDVVAEQNEEGMIPSIAPSIAPHRLDSNDMGKVLDGSAGWGDAITMIPVALYKAYGDRQILENQYEAAKAWVEYMIKNARNHNDFYADEAYYRRNEDGSCDGDYIWDTKFHWGEWSEPNFVMDGLEGNFIDDRLKRGNPVVATAYLRYSSYLLSKMAGILGKKDDEVHYRNYSQKVAEVYNKYLIEDDGNIRFSDPGRQAAYARVLRFNLVSHRKRAAVKAKLMELIEKENYHLNTGFLSTNFLLNLLAEEGEVDVAYRILEQKDYPSWLYPVVNGATTTYESWDGTDQYFGSFNHYSLGAVCDFIFSYVTGIRIDEDNPGYKHFYIRPVIGGSLTYAESTFESPYGKIKSGWNKTNNGFKYSFEIPANTSATVELPDGRKLELGSGKYEM